METENRVHELDIPIVKLTPVRTRTISAKNYAKIVANLKAVGLIEPLCVCKHGDEYFILDGVIRYRALLEHGVQVVPCLVLESKDLYTLNRQVNYLSPKQEVEMLRKALTLLDEESVAKAFGLTSLKTRLGTNLNKDLHPDILSALESGKISRGTAQQLAFVLPKRQAEIIALMRQGGDWSSAFARAQVIRTPLPLRSKRRLNGPWERSQENKRKLITKLQEIGKQQDFYSGLYQQYSGDLLKLSTYIRQITHRPALHDYLKKNHPEALSLFESVIAISEGKVAV